MWHPYRFFSYQFVFFNTIARCAFLIFLGNKEETIVGCYFSCFSPTLCIFRWWVALTKDTFSWSLQLGRQVRTGCREDVLCRATNTSNGNSKIRSSTQHQESSKAAKAATTDIFACGLRSYANWHSKQSAAKSSGGLPCATCHLPPAPLVLFLFLLLLCLPLGTGSL